MTILRFASEQVIGTGFIAGVMVDSTTGQSVSIPETFREAVARYQA
jgi:acyl-CoA thioesterase FadM